MGSILGCLLLSSSVGFFSPSPFLLGSAERFARIFFSVAVRLLRLILGSVCFGVSVPLASLLCRRRLRTFFCARARRKFDFQVVDALTFPVVFSTFRR